MSIYWSEAINAVAQVVPRVVEDKAAIIIVNRTIYEIWRRYDWKEYGKILEPFWLIGGVQDYPWAVPANFWGLQKAFLVRMIPEPAEVYPLRVLRDLDLTHQRQLPHAIGWSKSRNSIRVFPAPLGGVESPQWCVKGEYKLMPTKLTSVSVYDNFIAWDDIHFSTVCEVLKWCALDYVGSPGADAQMKKALFLLDRMAEDEGVAEGDGTTAPASGLALGGTTGSWSSNQFNRVLW